MSGRDHGELRELLCKLSDGMLTNEEACRLNLLLKDDPIAQESYLDHLMIDGLLQREFAAVGAGSFVGGGRPQAESTTADRSQSIGRRLRNWLPPIVPRYSRWVLAATCLLLAGIVTGRFLSIPRGSEVPPLPLALWDAGFENEATVESAATTTALWYGDTTESVEQFIGVTPVEGLRMLRFVKSSAEPESTCEVYQIIDLQPLGDLARRGTLVEASAFFNSLQSERDEDYTFGITVFAFSENPLQESKIWPMRWRQPLIFSGRQLPADAAPQSWQQVDTRLALPEGARYLVLQLSVSCDNPEAVGPFPGQFADNVALHLVSSR